MPSRQSNFSFFLSNSSFPRVQFLLTSAGSSCGPLRLRRLRGSATSPCRGGIVQPRRVVRKRAALRRSVLSRGPGPSGPPPVTWALRRPHRAFSAFWRILCFVVVHRANMLMNIQTNLTTQDPSLSTKNGRISLVIFCHFSAPNLHFSPSGRKRSGPPFGGPLLCSRFYLFAELASIGTPPALSTGTSRPCRAERASSKE